MDLKNKPYYLFLLSLLSGVLFWLGWPTKPMPFFLFAAFVPLLIVEEKLAVSGLKRRGWKFLGYAYIALLTWNVLTTYWIYNATAGGGIFAMAANAFLMCMPLMLFHHTKRLTTPALGYASFVVYWITFEYLHLNWQLSWPWLTLGNAFASTHFAVQWYEYTGALGGTLWVLLMNILLWMLLKQPAAAKQRKKYIVLFAASFLLPLIISVVMYYSWQEQGEEVEVAVIQPNIDPYEEKFEGSPKFIPYEAQLERLITLSDSAITNETRYVVWPETALPYGFLEDELHQFPIIHRLQQFVKEHPNVTLITGLDTYKIYQTKATPSSVYIKGYGYQDAFNSAMQINERGEIVIYHKSKLVPGVEYMPPALASFAIAVGEAAHGLGTQNTRTVFFNKDHIGIAPVICYESIFGEFVTEYVQKGAGVIFIITNDGWWGNTQGHRQHLQYASLRAIENRKDIARSANTGISGFIDQKGDVLERSGYWEQKIMKRKIRYNSIKTFYTLHGDYIGKLSAFASVAAFVLALILGLRKKRAGAQVRK